MVWSLSVCVCDMRGSDPWARSSSSLTIQFIAHLRTHTICSMATTNPFHEALLSSNRMMRIPLPRGEAYSQGELSAFLSSPQVFAWALRDNEVTVVLDPYKSPIYGMRALASTLTHIAVAHAIQTAGLAAEEPLALPLSPAQLGIAPQHMFNLDALSIVLRGETKLPVTTAKEPRETSSAAALLHTHREKVPHCLRQFFLTSADGALTCTVVVIRDESVLDIHYRELCRGDNSGDGHELWLVLMPKENNVFRSKAKPRHESQDNAKMDVEDEEEEDDEEESEYVEADVELMKFAMMKIFLARVLGRRAQDRAPLASGTIRILSHEDEVEESASLMSDNDDMLQEGHPSSSSSSSSSAAAAPSPPPPTKCIYFDTEVVQCDAICTVAAVPASRNGVALIKLPGGLSGAFQPLEAMSAHSVIQKFVKSKEYNKIAAQDCPEWLPIAEEVLKPLDKASRDCYLQYLRKLPRMLSLAFTRDIVQSGWKATGLMPLDHQVMLRKCAGWDGLKQYEQDRILQAIPPMIREVQQHGCVDNAVLKELIPTINVTCRNR